jgi:hypothetical protein
MNTVEWVQAVGDLVTTLDNLVWQLRDLQAMPACGDLPPAERLRLLLELRERLRVPSINEELCPSEAVGRRVAGAVAGSEQDVYRAVTQIAHDLDRAVADCLAKGGTNPDVIDSSLFRQVAYVGLPRHDGRQQPVALGLVHSLPDGCPLRLALPPGGYYRTEAGDALVLGLAVGANYPYEPAVPKPWYSLNQAVVRTRAWRGEQAAREEQQRQQLESRQAEGVSYGTNPHAEISRLRQENALLKRQASALNGAAADGAGGVPDR